MLYKADLHSLEVTFCWVLAVTSKTWEGTLPRASNLSALWSILKSRLRQLQNLTSASFPISLTGLPGHLGRAAVRTDREWQLSLWHIKMHSDGAECFLLCFLAILLRSSRGKFIFYLPNKRNITRLSHWALYLRKVSDVVVISHSDRGPEPSSPC